MTKFQETENIELKKSTSELKEAVISIVAMLNKHQRGEVWFGIRNDGTVSGQQVSEKTMRDVSKAISENIEPKVYPTVEQVAVDGKHCIKVQVKGNEHPYYAYGRPYIRVGDEDRQLSAKELERLILEKNRDRLRWDTEVCDKATFEDIGASKLKSFLKLCSLPYDTIPNSLEKLNLVKGGKLLNAAVLCFARKPEKFLPNARLRCAVFGTLDTTVTLDMKDFYGDAFNLIGKAEEYIMEHINIGMRLDGLLRVDVPEIDREAFREAIINAFCHRDYREYDSVNIAIFKDRVEIRSPGLLYGGLTIDSIKKKMVSARRNELLAELFQRSHRIEKWGRGIKMILEREPATEFEEVGTVQFVVTFKRKYAEAVTTETALTTSVKTSVKTSDEIIAAIRSDKLVTAQQIAERLGISLRAIEMQLANLKKDGRIRRIGPKKGGYWETVVKNIS
ncbi:MAG: ATP-binding protein [Desulfuromonadaceae bacterium]|nr:ATP-binding protein [Desulfuromonadaceae bacterium]